MRQFYLFIILFMLSLKGFGQYSIYFGFDIYKLSAANKKILKGYLPALKSETIVIHGYTDSVGGTAYNDALSMRRVKTVKKYLIALGVSPEQIQSVIGHGESTTANQQRRNRRVDIVLGGQKYEGQSTAALGAQILELKVRETLAIENLEFLPGRHVLQPYSQKTLEELLAVLKTNPNLKVEIQGHICCTYTGVDGMDKDTRTRNLSTNRAHSIYQYLVENGIDKDRLTYKGYAATRPLVREITKEDQQRNRRVEILILEK